MDKDDLPSMSTPLVRVYALFRSKLDSEDSLPEPVRQELTELVSGASCADAADVIAAFSLDLPETQDDATAQD